MAARRGFTRRVRLSLVLAVFAAAVAFAAVALADVVAADADVVTADTQTSVNLGTVAPGASITRSVGFTLVCAQRKHVDLSESVTIEFRPVGSGSTAPTGGSLTATNTSIGPVPASWPDDDTNCPSGGQQLPGSPSTVTLTAPSAGGTYTYTVQYRIGISGPTATAGDNSSDVTGSGAESVTYTLTVPSKQDQTIDFPPIAEKVFGDADFGAGAGASASSGLPVTYTATGDCSAAGGTIHITGAGSCSVTASQAGNDAYNPAPSVTRSFNIAKANQTITFAQPTTPQALGSVFAVSASSSSGLGVAIGASGVCSYNGLTGMVTMTAGTGACVLSASQSGNDDFNAAADVIRTVDASKAGQTITFEAPSGVKYGDADFDLGAAASSGLAVSYSSSTPSVCTVVDSKLRVVAAGSCSVTASQPGDDHWAAAADVPRTFTIRKAAASLSLTDLSKTYNGSPQGATIVSIPVGLAGLSVTYDGSASEPTNAGSYAVVASLDNTNYEATDATGTLEIARKAVTGSATVADKVYDGDISAAITGRQVQGAIAGDDVQLSGGTASFADKRVEQDKAVTVSGATLTGADKDNYELRETSANRADITSRPIGGDITVADKVYDGDVSASITDRSLNAADVVSGDLVSLAGGNATFADKNVGVDKTVTASGFTLGGADGGNYHLAPATITTIADITQRPIEVGAYPQSKEYGNDDPALTYIVTSGSLVAGDGFAGGLTRRPGQNVGSYDIEQGTLTAGDNYVLTFRGAQLTITQRPIGVTADPQQKILNAPDPLLTYKVTSGSLVSGDGFTGALTRQVGEEVGTYAILRGTLTAGPNYALDYTGAALKVVYAWNGYLQPINDTAHQTGAAQSKFKLGQTIPAKFVIRDARGAAVQQTGSPTFSRSGNLGSCDAQTEPESISEAVTPDAGVAYVWDGNQYHYNWSTKALTAGEYRIYANLADGTKRYVDICLTK